MAKSEKDRMFEINIALANDGEPATIFVGADGRDFLIKRGEDVKVPMAVLGALDSAVKGVDEIDPYDDTKRRVVERRRFAYTVKREL